MNKIYIIGSVASGKTTLSKEISNVTGIPCYELDSIVHQKVAGGQRKRTPDEQVAEIDRIDNEGDWIIEGTYRKTCDKVMDISDVIIFLDTTLWLRKVRIIKRFVKQQLGIEKCNYKSDIVMLRLMFKWTNDFETDRDAFNNMLSQYHEKVYIVKRKEEAMELLNIDITREDKK
jgi:adenylate kinase family enzyme